MRIGRTEVSINNNIFKILDKITQMLFFSGSLYNIFSCLLMSWCIFYEGSCLIQTPVHNFSEQLTETASNVLNSNSCKRQDVAR